MGASNPGVTNAMKVRNFKLTDHLAREWYDNADSKGDYEKLKGDFSRHFSTQGQSVRNLHARCERSQNTILLASTQAVYKHRTVQYEKRDSRVRESVSHRTDVRAAVAVAVGSLRA